jgi:signal peptidase I
VREYAEAIIIAIILALIIRTFVVQAFKIPSGSMIPTLVIGDHILVNKFLFGVKIPFTDRILFSFDTPEQRDIIVFKYPEDEDKDFIKRVVGTPGDRISLRDKVLYVNDIPMVEPYIQHTDSSILPAVLHPRDNFGPITVPPDQYFVMGDNRDQSLDGRFWGFVNREKVKGKAFFIYWSWDRENTNVRWNRLGKTVH